MNIFISSRPTTLSMACALPPTTADGAIAILYEGLSAQVVALPSTLKEPSGLCMA